MGKFDVVIGNPPFQKQTQRNINQGGGYGQKIWHKFIEVAFDVVNSDNGIVSFITPHHWRMGESTSVRKAQELIWNNVILDVIPANKYFNVGGMVTMDAWTISTNKNDTGMRIHPLFKKLKFLPHEQSKDIINFLEAAENEDTYNTNVHDNRHYYFDAIRQSPKGDKKHPYPHINTFPQFEKGLFDWYNKKTDNFDNKKVLLSTVASKNRKAYYDNGKYGAGHCSYGYLVDTDEDGKMLENFINNSKIVEKLNVLSRSGFAFSARWIFKIPKSWVKRFNDETN